jgi:hypothetical protein
MIRTTVALAALSLHLGFGCKKPIDPDVVELVEVARPAFSAKLPDWKVVESTHDAAMGKHKVQIKGGGFAEVSWQGGDPMTAEELEQLGKSVVTGFRLQLADEAARTRPDEDHYTVVATLSEGGRTVWMWMTMIQCHKTNVTITLGVGTTGERASRRLGERIHESFQCRGDSPDEFVISISPSSDLGDDFGYAPIPNGEILAHADGRSVVVFRSGGDFSEAIRKRPAETLKTFEELIGVRITGHGNSTKIDGIGGVPIWVVTATLDGRQPIAAASLFCKEAGATFMLLAIDDAGRVSADQLVELTRQFGCPAADWPGLSERKSACEVGATAYCGDEAP